MSFNSTNKSKSTQSSKMLYVVLVLTLLITAWTALNSQDDPVDAGNDLLVDKFERHSPQHEPSQTLIKRGEVTKLKVLENQNPYEELVPWQKLKRDALENNPHDVFKVHSWVVVTPVKKIKPLPSPAPVAPDIPFTYVGKLEEHPKGMQVFLMENNKLYSTYLGDKINAQWRLDSEDTTTLQLTYLPLNLKQVLAKSTKQINLVAQVVNQ